MNSLSRRLRLNPLFLSRPIPLSTRDASLDNECDVPLSNVKGPHAEVTFKNKTEGDLSLYLYSYKTAFGCGVGDVIHPSLESVTTSVPKGCYDFYGWITGPKDSTPAGDGCLKFDQTV